MTQQNPFQNRQTRPPGEVDEFELMRRRLKQRGATTGQERQQELSRQFASLGNLPSGAAIKTRQKAATASERATNEALQDVNILEAQTLRQEREGQAERDVRRELMTQELASREREGAATRQTEMDLGNLAATTDLEKARMAGASAREVANIQADTAVRVQELQNKGLDDRVAKEIASREKLFNLEMNFNDQNQSWAEQIARSEYEINKSVTAIHAVDLLRANGFDHNDVSGLLKALGIPYADRVTDFLMQGATGSAPPPNVNTSGGYQSPWAGTDPIRGTPATSTVPTNPAVRARQGYSTDIYSYGNNGRQG